MALPASIEYSPEPIREAFMELSRQRDIAQERVLGLEKKLALQRGRVDGITANLKEARRQRELAEKARKAVKGTEAEALYQNRVKAADREIEHLQNKVKNPNIRAAELEAEVSKSRTLLDQAQAKLDAVEQAGVAQ